MISFNSDSHWRDSARNARFWIFDAEACFPLLLFLLHIKLWTLIVAIIAMIFFTMLNRHGFTVRVFLRVCRTFLAGNHKIAKPWWV